MRYTALAVLFSALWAGAFVVVKIALASSPALFLMAVRFLAAGLLLHGDPSRASAYFLLNPVLGSRSGPYSSVRRSDRGMSWAPPW